MPRRTEISSILAMGAGPIVMGRSCEFDYSGTHATKVRHRAAIWSAAALFAAVILTSSPVGASVSGWHYGKWHLVIGSAENIVVLAQDGKNIDVEARTDGGAEIRIGFETPKCGVSEDASGARESFKLSRRDWDRIPFNDRLKMLKEQFQGWSAQANFLCPARRHGVDLRKLGEALRQFDGQLAMIGG